jgi:hypothetical protein
MMRGAILLAMAAGPAGAEVLFAPPAGCEVFATLQAADCTVEQLMRCEGQEGVTSVTLYADGGDFVSVTDAEGQWLMSHDGLSGMTSTLVEPQADASLLSDLLAAGRQSYDFTMVDRNGVTTRYAGKENLTGEEVTIGGVRLLRTENRMEAFGDDGTRLWGAVAQDYVSPDWRVYLRGTALRDTDAGGEYRTDATPVAISRPGEPGYLATVAPEECAQ